MVHGESALTPGDHIVLIRAPRDVDTAVGGPSFKQYAHNPIYEVDCPSAAQMK